MLYVNENSGKGTVVGTLTSNDPDASQTHTYKLIKSPGNLFAVHGDKLEVCCSKYANCDSYLLSE